MHVRRKGARHMIRSNRLQRRICRVFSSLSLLMMILMCNVSYSQTDREITLQMLDPRSGQPITTSESQVWAAESATTAQTGGVSPRYVKPGKDGVGKLTLRPGSSVITIHAQYGKAGSGYVNCDRIKDRAKFREHWYSTSEILSTGIVAPNYCSKRKARAKPGQFIFFVRPMTFWERLHE